MHHGHLRRPLLVQLLQVVGDHPSGTLQDSIVCCSKIFSHQRHRDAARYTSLFSSLIYAQSAENHYCRGLPIGIVYRPYMPEVSTHLASCTC